MLVDLLAVVIGFAAVMLLLSLFVMSLAQLTQHMLRLRVRNFEYGIEGLLEKARKADDKYDPGEVARKVIEFATLPSLKCGGLFDKVLSWAGRGKCTWLTGDELAAALSRVSEVTADRIEEVKTAFPLAERQMRGSMLAIMRYASVIWAAMVACVFQVSTPALLERLTIDSLYRQKLAETTASLLDQAEEIRASPGPDSSIRAEGATEPSESRTELSQPPGEGSVPGKERQDVRNEADHTAITTILTEAPDTGGRFVRDYGEILDHLRAELKKRPSDLSRTEEDADRRSTPGDDLVDGHEDIADGSVDREAILRELAALLDALGEGEIVTSVQESREIQAQLGVIEITPWPHGRAFYADAANCVGVLMTTILLTLGAPFWFNVLKSAVNLRDTLEPKQEKQAKTDSGDGQQP